MATLQELGLADFFTESNMRIQSSTIYKALRGDGMRVRPLARNRCSFGKSHLPQANSENRVRSFPEKGRVAVLTTMFESKAEEVKSGSPKKPAKEFLLRQQPTKSQSRLVKSSEPFPKPKGVARRELTPVSESSHQRVPFRSTKLERPVSRASLKEDENDRKPKTHRRKIDSKNLKKKSSQLFSVLPTEKRGKGETKQRPSFNVTQGVNSNKEKATNRKKIGVVGRATVVAGRAVNVQKQQPVVHRNVDSKKAETNPKVTSFPQKSQPRLEKKSKPHEKLARIPSLPKTPISKMNARNPIVREVATKPRLPVVGSSSWKQLWFPSETRESYNLFCPDTKAKKTTVRRRRPLRRQNKSVVKVSKGTSKVVVATPKTTAKNKFENTTDEEESSESEDEELSAMLARRYELKKKSLEFFKQFRYGEMLRRSMPEITYSSEISTNSEIDLKRRLPELEIRMRLNRLEESVSKIKEFVPRWTGILKATRDDVSKMEKIQRTLVNAEQILDVKVGKAKQMLQKYLSLIDSDKHSPPTEEMENMINHSELVQLDVNSLERVFESFERQLQHELDEPTSVSL